MKKLRGFTLVELIIVIVIIGILATITIIGYQSQAASARRNSILTAMTEATKALNVCLANAETPTTVAVATLTGLVANAAGPNVCSVATSVSGTWPNPKTIGGSAWGYSTTTGGVGATGITAGSPLLVSNGTDTVTCTNTGCVKSW